MAPALPVLASIGDRLVALVFDALVGVGLFFFFGILFAARFGGMTDSGFDMTGAPAIGLIALVSVLMLGYFVVGDLAGATLGKLALEIRVRTVDGHRITLRASVIRNLFRLVDGLGVYLVGALFVLFTKRKQRLGDLVAGTIVVRRESSRGLRIAGALGAAAIAGLGIGGGFYLKSIMPTDTSPVLATSGSTGTESTPSSASTVMPSTSMPVSPGAPRYASAMLTDSRTGTTERTSFRPDVSEIVLRFTLADVPASTTLRSVWIAEDVQGEAPHRVIDEASVVTAAGANSGFFNLTRRGQAWSAGSYRVELYLGSQLAQTLRFRIEGSLTPMSGTARPGTPGGAASPPPLASTALPIR